MGIHHPLRFLVPHWDIIIPHGRHLDTHFCKPRGFRPGMISTAQLRTMFDRISHGIIQYRLYFLVVAVVGFLYLLNWEQSLHHPIHITPAMRPGSGIHKPPTANKNTDSLHYEECHY